MSPTSYLTAPPRGVGVDYSRGGLYSGSVRVAARRAAHEERHTAAVPPPQHNTRLVQRFVEGWAQGDASSALECAHPMIEMDWSDSEAPFRGTYRGHAGLERLMAEIREGWDDFHVDVEDVIECAPDRVVTAAVARGRGGASGIELEARASMLWTVQDRRVLHGRLFQTREEALTAARATTA